MYPLGLILHKPFNPIQDTTMRPFHFLTGLLILILAGLFVIYIVSKPKQDSPLNPAQTPVAKKIDSDMDKTTVEILPFTEKPKVPAFPSANQTVSPAPLKIEFDHLKIRDQMSQSELGPVKPSPTPTPDLLKEQPLLPLNEKASKDKLLYGYSGKEEEDHKVMIGVQKGDVTIKSDIKKSDEETEVQHIEIEIKLPK